MLSWYQGGMVTHAAVNACLAPLCSVDGMAVTTVEGIGSSRGLLHPVQVGVCNQIHLHSFPSYSLFDSFQRRLLPSSLSACIHCCYASVCACASEVYGSVSVCVSV